MRKVLVLEDEENIRSFVVINLKRAGYTTIEAGCGMDALAALKANPDIKVALLDIMLFDSMGIYGSKIYMVWNDCCGRDMKKFKETIQAFREGKFSVEEIQENLSRVRAKPFI